MKLDPGFLSVSPGGQNFCPDCEEREIDGHARTCPRMAALRLLRVIASRRGPHQQAAARLVRQPLKGKQV
jgi:hypothetical protein